MSLILEVYPVPWKILDLIKARILKNRAKKSKTGIDWGEDLKREMSLQPGPLSRRRRDEPSFIYSQEVNVGRVWWHIGHNYTVTSDNITGSNSYNTVNFGWDNGVPPGRDLVQPPPNLVKWDPSTGPTTRRRDFQRTSSAVLEFVITVGSGSGETWKRVKHTVNFSGSYYGSGEERYIVLPSPHFPEYSTIVYQNNALNRGSNNFTARLWYSFFPVGDSSTIFVVSIAQFSVNGWLSFRDQFTGTSGGNDGVRAVENKKQISFLITQTDVTELTHPIPAFIQKIIDLKLKDGSIRSEFHDPNMPDWTLSTALASSIGSYSGGVSSAIFERVATDGTISGVTPQQAKASYAASSGNPEIPVLRYKRDNPSVGFTPTTEKGFFGIIPDASVTSNITSEMLAAEMEDQLEQTPGANAADQPEPVSFIFTYDYHGGNYCRDQLSRLGITL